MPRVLRACHHGHHYHHRLPPATNYSNEKSLGSRSINRHRHFLATSPLARRDRDSRPSLLISGFTMQAVGSRLMFRPRYASATGNLAASAD